MPPIDPNAFPYCDRCKRRHDMADPTDRCGVHMGADLLWLIGLAIVALIGYAMVIHYLPMP